MALVRLLVNFWPALSLVLSATTVRPVGAQRTNTRGLSIINAPGPGNPGHAGSDISISVEISGDGKFGEQAANPSSTLQSHYSSLQIYLVSSETNANFTVSSGTDFLTRESGTVRHLNWPIPDCISPGNYNLTFYEAAQINSEPRFVITPINIPIDNAGGPSGPCIEGTNALQQQPQPDSPPPSPPLPNGEPVTTITMTGPMNIPTVTVTPTTPLSTVVLVSMVTLTTTITGPERTVTSTITSGIAITTSLPGEDISGFVPVVQDSAESLSCSSYLLFVPSIWIIVSSLLY